LKLPHQEGFPYRQPIVIGVSVICVALGTLWPGQSAGERLYDFGVAILSFALCYGATRLILWGLAVFMQEHLTGLPLWILLIIFYGGVLATLSGLLTAPFQWHDVHQSGATAPAILASLPSGLYTAAGTLKVIERYHWADRAD